MFFLFVLSILLNVWWVSFGRLFCWFRWVVIRCWRWLCLSDVRILVVVLLFRWLWLLLICVFSDCGQWLVVSIVVLWLDLSISVLQLFRMVVMCGVVILMFVSMLSWWFLFMKMNWSGFCVLWGIVQGIMVRLCIVVVLLFYSMWRLILVLFVVIVCVVFQFMQSGNDV